MRSVKALQSSEAGQQTVWLAPASIKWKLFPDPKTQLMDEVGSDKKVTLKWIQGDLSHNTIILKPLDK